MRIYKCRICRSTGLKLIFSLGEQPLANSLLSSKNERPTKFPLEWLQCQHCSLIQLSEVVPKEILFEEYFYIPSVSKDHLKDFDQMAYIVGKTAKLKKGDLVVDVGGSDGSLLKCFQYQFKTKVINVEPAQNIDCGDIPVIRKFFDAGVAGDIRKQFGEAKLITMTNVFAHIDDLQEVIKALDILLTDDGIFFARFPDVRNLLEENQFDTIYHEHLSYFTAEPLYHLFTMSPFEIFDIEYSLIHGGSMMIYVRRRQDNLAKFIENVKKIRHDLHKFITEQKAEGKKIIGFGAAAKGTMLLNICNLTDKLIDYVADGTPYKQGKFIPGVKIPVLPENEIDKNPPDIILILAWNWKDEIMRKLKGRGFTFVIPIPEIEVIEDSYSPS